MTQKEYTKPASVISLSNAQKALEDHGFKVEVVSDLDAARRTVLGMVPEGSEVFTATSDTINQAGLTEIFNESGKYDSVRKKIGALAGQPGKEIEMHRLGSAAEFSVGSIQALTEDGQALVASASGSQLPGYVYGANHVIWVVGAQKIVKDLQAGLDRLETHVLELENERALKAYGSKSSLNKILIYRREGRRRVTVVLVKEAAGY